MIARSFLQLTGAARRLVCDSSGVAAVDFALVGPAFLMLLLGIFEFGRVMHANNTLAHAVHEAGRYAMVHGADSEEPASASDIKALIKNRAIGLDPDKIVVPDPTFAPDNEPGSTVTITASYPFDFMLPFTATDAVTLNAATSMVIMH